LVTCAWLIRATRKLIRATTIVDLFHHALRQGQAGRKPM
jgi:hypothetical protein